MKKDSNLLVMFFKNERLRVSSISIIVGSLILALKFWAYQLTGSAALKSDALESIVNVVSAVFTFGAIVFAERPADESHPYGHGKIEYFSAAFEGGLISLAAILILYEAVRTFISGHPVTHLDTGMILNLSAGLMNGILGFWLIRFGRRKHSKAIEADGHHVVSDFYTTLGLIVGLLIIRLTGYFWLDPVLAALIGLLLIRTGFKLVRESSAALLDKEDPKLISRLIEGMNHHRPKDVIDVHALRTLRSGRHTHIDIHVAVPEFYSLEQAHDVVKIFGNDVMKDLELEGEFHTHIDPCKKLYCEYCEVSPCGIRRAACQRSETLTLEKSISLAPLIRK